MSSEVKIQNYQQYQAYENDGLELFISKANGEVKATQSALARMLGMQQGHLSSVLKRPLLPGSTNPEKSEIVKLQTADGTIRECTLYSVPTIITLAQRYNKDLAMRFAEMGATVYLYQLAGFKVSTDINNKLPVLAEETYADHLKTAHEALGKLMNIHRFAEDKPGLEAYLELAEKPRKNQLSGKMTLQEMAEYYGIELDAHHSRQLGRSLAGVSRSQEGEEPTTVRKRSTSPSGHAQSYKVSEYSVDYLPLFGELVKAYGIH